MTNYTSAFIADSSTLPTGSHPLSNWLVVECPSLVSVPHTHLLSITDFAQIAPDGIDGIEQVDLITNAGPSKRKDMIYNIDMELETGPPNFGAMAARFVNLQSLTPLF
eukprot:GHVO01019178.1.p1 GENE.GHVO01019178.1~~GHVO01019178.1.p1  ORF type:complete len:108 (-),score=6.45 GHVO01019178.1:247-570(-)